jgi:hypothetical protein
VVIVARKAVRTVNVRVLLRAVCFIRTFLTRIADTKSVRFYAYRTPVIIQVRISTHSGVLSQDLPIADENCLFIKGAFTPTPPPCKAHSTTPVGEVHGASRRIRPSAPGRSYLSGQQLCVKINSTLRCVGQPPVGEPPAPVVFGPNPVGDLTIDYDPAANVRLRLAMGAAGEDIMLFAQAPCSAGCMKHRRVNYLGLV